VAAFFRDVAGRREAAGALSASDARLKAVLEIAPIGIIFTEAPRGRGDGNPHAERILSHPILEPPTSILTDNGSSTIPTAGPRSRTRIPLHGRS
jgi:hypothetical protein